MNALDYLVLIGTLIGIAAYGVWRTRGIQDLNTYLRGSGETRWLTIGLSVMATQASAVTCPPARSCDSAAMPRPSTS